MILAIKLVLFLNAALLILMSLRGVLIMREEALVERKPQRASGRRS